LNRLKLSYRALRRGAAGSGAWDVPRPGSSARQQGRSEALRRAVPPAASGGRPPRAAADREGGPPPFEPAVTVTAGLLQDLFVPGSAHRIPFAADREGGPPPPDAGGQPAAPDPLVGPPLGSPRSFNAWESLPHSEPRAAGLWSRHSDSRVPGDSESVAEFKVDA
jgi:hypothetical protein